VSSDNGIYLLKSKDGCRVAHAQCIENLYWWSTNCCKHQEIIDVEDEDFFGIEICKNCKSAIKWEERKELNPKMLLDYFGDSQIFISDSYALDEALRIQKEEGWTEYGICYISGWECKEFPRKEE